MQVAEEMIGGSAWINLINTIRLQNGEVTDRLDEEAYLAFFLLANELCDEAQVVEMQAPSTAELLRGRIRELRGLFSEVIASFDAGLPMTEAQASALSAFVSSLAVEYAYTLHNSDSFPQFQWRGKTWLDQVLLQLVQSFTSTIETVSPDRIRKCEHEHCLLHFVDTSKAGKRRWCSMNTCGNRVKASNFYSKRKKKTANEDTVDR